MSPVDPRIASAARFRLPVSPPTSALLVASLASIAGSFQLLAWALARLPIFFVVLGVALIAVGLGFGLAALVRHYRLRWVAYVGDDSLSIVNGPRRRVLPWADVAGARLVDHRLDLYAVPIEDKAKR